MGKDWEKCGNCKFFQNGLCMRYPPQIYVVDVSTDNEFGTSTEGWPSVEQSNWCGEWVHIDAV